MEIIDQKYALEAILFANGSPISAKHIADCLEIDISEVHYLISELMAEYESNNRGIKIVRLIDSYQMCSSDVYTEFVRRALDKRRNTPLSNSALEILSIVAYNQPVTKSYVEQIRGVDCFYGINSLVEKGLLEEKGRLDAPGRPILYGTTMEFLRIFGISELSDLPNLPKMKTPDEENDTQEKFSDEILNVPAQE